MYNNIYVMYKYTRNKRKKEKIKFGFDFHKLSPKANKEYFHSFNRSIWFIL